MSSVTGDQAVSFVCAALAACGNALANIMQRKASLEQPPGQRFGLGLLAALVRNSTWILGFTGMVASFVLQAVALGLGPLSAVEPIITLEVPLTMLFASRVFHVRIGRPEWIQIWTMTLGMILLIGVLNPQPGDEQNIGHVLYALAGGCTVGFIALLLVAAQRGGVVRRTACLGAAAGTSFGLTATFIKETTAQLSAHGVLGIVTTWQTYAAVGLGIAGVVIMQWALHTGPLLAAQPGFTLMDPLVSILWGTLVYNETTRSGLWLLPAVVGAAAIGGSVTLLARSPLLATLDEHEVEGYPGSVAYRT